VVVAEVAVDTKVVVVVVMVEAKEAVRQLVPQRDYRRAPQKGCSEQLGEMLNDINAERSSPSSFKGLAQRFSQILKGRYADPGHIQQFQNRQRNLKSKIDNYRNSGCGDPPAQVTQWANMPVASPWTPPNLQKFTAPSWLVPAAVVTGAVACAAFVPGCLEAEGAAAAVAP
jgi:hypothetical protein